MAWNFGLILLWGVIHTIVAQKSSYDTLAKTFPLPVLRASNNFFFFFFFENNHSIFSLYDYHWCHFMDTDGIMAAN